MSGSLSTRGALQLSQPNALLNVAMLGQGQADEQNFRRNALMLDTAQRQVDTDRQFRALAPAAIGGDAAAQTQLMELDPERKLQLDQHIQTMDAGKRKAAADRALLFGQEAGALLSVPEADAARLWPTTRSNILAAGVDPAGLPEAFPGIPWLTAHARRADSLHNTLKAYDEKPVIGGGNDTTVPRGIRNNNPGNIKDGPFARGLPGYKGTDGTFAVFETADHGMAAADTLLAQYGQQGLNTPAAIIAKWAPASGGNNVGAYAGRVAQALGVQPNQAIDMNDPAVRGRLLQAMVGVENGARGAQMLVTRGTGLPVTQGAAAGKAWARGPDGQMVQVPIQGAGEPVKPDQNFQFVDPNNPRAGQEPIKGGPADLDYLRAKAAATSEGKGGNPLPDSSRKRLGEMGDRLSGAQRLLDTFKPEFRSGIGAGSVENFVGRNIGFGYGDQAQWWQDYDAYANVVRHELYGSALTATEQRAWDRANITPNMQPDQIMQNLARQRDIVSAGMRRYAAGLVLDRYSPEVVSATLGVPVNDILRTVEEVRGMRGGGAPGARPGQAGPPPSAGGGYGEGAVIENGAGQRMVLRGGQWRPAQ